VVDTGARPGGRSARVRTAVLEATLAELVEHGPGGASIEAVATRAGVHKTTVYRRWGTRDKVVAEALLEVSSREIPAPDTGSVVDDLRALMHATAVTITSPMGGALIRVLVAEADRVPQVRAVLHEFWEQRFAVVGEVVRRGIDRGDLPATTDVELLTERLIGPLYLRLLVTLRPVDAAYADEVLSATLG
jgi:AcrR family transcriptional regulator